MSDALVTVVIPMHGLAPMTLDCIRSVQAGAPPHRMIVVDDASPDDAGGWLRERAPEVEVLTLPRNVGYGRAVNQGVALATTPVVVVLNNDTMVEPGFLEAITAPLIHGPETHGSVNAVVLRADGHAIESAGIAFDQSLAPYSRLAGHRPADADGFWPPLVGPGGAAAAYRRTAWRQCRGFDERIPAYYEDVDLCLRLHGAGWTTTVATGARVRHLGGRTYGTQPRRVTYLAAYGRGYTLHRHRHLLRGTGAAAIGLEAIVALLASARRRSTLPARGRIAGWRAATPLPAPGRRPPMIVGVLAGLRHRWWHRRAQRT